jgi:hypothetical protein
MKKLLFIFLFSILSLQSKSQIMNHTSLELENSKQVTMTLYRYNFNYLFGVDFFNFEDCLNNSKIYIITSNGKVKTIKSQKLKNCEKEVIYFKINKWRLDPNKIDIIIYQDLKNSTYYKFNF